jgi:uncharacterized protein (DUF1330 family)
MMASGVLKATAAGSLLALALMSSGCLIVRGPSISVDEAAARELTRATENMGRAATEAAAAGAAPALTAPPCYLVVEGTVTDRENFRRYVAALPPLYQKYGGEYVTVGRPVETLEGSLDFQSFVMSRWRDCDSARAFWNSPEYRQLVEMRRDWGTFDAFLVNGITGSTTVAPMARSAN